MSKTKKQIKFKPVIKEDLTEKLEELRKKKIAEKRIEIKEIKLPEKNKKQEQSDQNSFFSSQSTPIEKDAISLQTEPVQNLEQVVQNAPVQQNVNTTTNQPAYATQQGANNMYSENYAPRTYEQITRPNESSPSLMTRPQEAIASDRVRTFNSRMMQKSEDPYGKQVQYYTTERQSQDSSIPPFKRKR